MTLTPEQIEGIPKEDLQKIRETADSLHSATVGILDTPLPAAEVERQVRLRTAMKLKIDESTGWMKGQVADLEALTREYRTLKGYQTSDESRLESYMFQRLREEKKGNS